MDFPVKRMLKPELKKFLGDRGMTVGDYSLGQLKELANKAIELNLPVIKTPDDTDTSMQMRSQVVVDGEVVRFPFVFSQDLKYWSDNLKDLPSFSEADAFVYFISKCDWKPSRLADYKSERGYQLFRAHHASNVLCHKLSHGHFYVKSKCIRETSQNCDPYNTWILMKEDGICVSAGCDCTGDDGGCKHVVCLLLSVANWSHRHEDRHTNTCTDVKCVWDQPRKGSNPQKMDEIEDTAQTKPFIHCYQPMVDRIDMCKVEGLMANLVKDCDAQICEIFDAPHSNKNNSVATLKECAERFDGSSSVFDYLSSCFDENDLLSINNMTLGQSANPLWFKYRVGRVTSSSMANVFKYKGSNENNYIVRQVFNADNTCLTAPMLYGKEREPLARQLYEKQYRNTHKCGKVRQSGLIVNKNMPHLGASPDGIVECKCCGKGILEIKCPYKFKNLSIDKICLENYHVRKDEKGCCVLKDSSDWYIQIQTQMAVAGVQWADFVMYLEGDPCTGKHTIHVERIVFDRLLWAAVKIKGDVFFESFVWPKLLK